MKYSYSLPKATAALAELDQHLGRCRNLGLVLDKFVPKEAIDDEGDPKKKGVRQEWLKGLAGRFEPRGNEQKPSEEDRQFLALWQARYRRWLALLTQTPGAVLFHAPLTWRVAVGLSGESVLETDLTLDRLSGLPIIPGSALKGLTRSWAVREHLKSASAKPEEDPPEIKDLFGVQEREHDRAGAVIFFDAFPIPPGLASSRPRFVVDIMNPHYPKYYGESAQRPNSSPPSNDQSPIPVFFLTVAGASFQFALAPRAGVTEVDIEEVAGWLQLALQEYGVGSKTNAGYGAFGEAQTGHPALPAAPRLNAEVLQRTGNQTRLRGKVQERAEDGVIVVFDDAAVTLPGFIPNARSGGRKLEPSNITPKCEVLGFIRRGGQTYIELDCPPKEK